MNKTLAIIAGIFTVAAIILVAFYFTQYPSNEEPQQTFADIPPEVDFTKPFATESKDLPITELSSAFPHGLPSEYGSEILKNSEITTPDGRVQSVRKFTTNKSLAEATNTYRDYFLANEWVLATTSNNDGTISTLLRKKNDLLSITAKVDKESGSNTIELNLTHQKGL